MKKPKLLLLGALLASFTFSASALDEAFDPNQIGNYTRSSGGRYLKSFALHNESDITGEATLGDVTINVNQPTTLNKSLYYDMTSQGPFVTRAGNTVKITDVDMDGYWVHGYLFIDYNNDGGFNSMLNTGFALNDSDPRIAAALNPNPYRGELVSFNYYNVDPTGIKANEYFVDSYGEHFDQASESPNTTIGQMRAFIIPSWVKPGIYNALYKHDWSDISQHGNPGTLNATGGLDNYIGDNGGVIVKFRIQVIGRHNVTVTSDDTSKGTVSLKVDDQATTTPTTVNSNQTVVAVATPTDGNHFAYWTDDATGQIVSREAEYTVTLTDDVKLTAHFLDQSEYEGRDEQFNPNNITSTYNHGTNSARFLSSFTLTNDTGNDGSLNEPQFTVNQSRAANSSIFYDLTSSAPFQTKAGNTVSFSEISWSKDGWMHGYLYIDYNKDGGFNSKLNTTGYTLNNDAMKNSSLITDDPVNGELVSFSCFNLNTTTDEDNDYFVDSKGNNMPKSRTNNTDIYYGSGVTTETMPEFKIPENLKPGTYDALFKIDWSDIRQHGNEGIYKNNAWSNRIGDNGGVIVKFQIKVEAPFCITDHYAANTSATYWNAAIVTINYTADGVDEGEKLVAVATQTDATTVTSTIAAASFTTLANDETGATEDQNVTAAHEISVDGRTIKFNLDEDQNQAQLLFEQPSWDAEGNKSDNFTPSTQYNYDIVLQTEDANGKVTAVSRPYSLDFTTAARNDGNTAGVEDVTADDSNAPVLYYNLQGIQVAQPAAGQIYIVRQGKTVKKVLMK